MIDPNKDLAGEIQKLTPEQQRQATEVLQKVLAKLQGEKRKPGRPPKKAVVAPESAPAWMDADLAAVIGDKDQTKRLALADELESKAKQLRGMKKVTPLEKTITFELTAIQFNAVVEYAKDHGCGAHPEHVQASNGTRWILERALSMLPAIQAASSRFCSYRDAEGLDNQELADAWCLRSLNEWRAMRAEKED